MNLKIILFFALVIIMNGSCKKNKEPEDPIKVAQRNLVDKQYVRVSLTSNPAYPFGDGTTSTDIYKDYYKDECVLDDFDMYRSDGTFVIDNGPTKCDPHEFQQTIFKWEFRENGTVIYIYKPGGTHTDTRKILINDGTTLKYEMIVKSISNTSHVWTETWIKK